MHDLGYRLQNAEGKKTTLIKFSIVIRYGLPLNRVNATLQEKNPRFYYDTKLELFIIQFLACPNMPYF